MAQDCWCQQLLGPVLDMEVDNLAVRNMEEAIQAIQEGTRLVATAEGDLRTLVMEVERLETVKDEVETVRAVASILRALEPLLTRLSPTDLSTSQLCASSPGTAGTDL